MQDMLDFVDLYTTEFIIGLIVLTVALFVYCIYLSRKLGRAMKRRDRKLPGESVGEITESLVSHTRALEDLRNNAGVLSGELGEQGQKLKKCLQRIGLVRFNAFDDVGGEQSFALVLLDAEGDGVAISSIYGRQDSRLYAKAISNADGERPLSDEEKAALQSALSDNQSPVGA